MSLVMNREDIDIFFSTDEELRVVVNFGGMCRTWPTIITTEVGDYKFKCNDFMQEWMIGDYSGTARYERIK